MSSVRAAPDDRPPMIDDKAMRFASCTKLLTSIMALQCVERGEISLDDAIDEMLPEVARFNVITGFDDTKKEAIERSPARRIILRCAVFLGW